MWQKNGCINVMQVSGIHVTEFIGTFLVRLSTTHPEYPFTISKVGSDKTFQHKRVKHLNDRTFSVPVRGGGTKEFKNMQELVKCDDLGLKSTCPKNQVDWYVICLCDVTFGFRNPYAEE